MSSPTISGRRPHQREPRAAVLRSSVVVAAAVCGATAAQQLSASTTDPAGYTPTLYVYQKNELVDVKTFKIADLEGCQRRASALLELYLNHSDIEDDMRVVVRCVPVPPPSAGHRKGERSTDDELHQRMAEVTL